MIDKECAWVVGWVHNLGCCWFVIYSLTVVGGDREHREQVDRREREHVIRIQMSEGNSQVKYSHSSMSQRVGQQSSSGEWKWSISEDLRVAGKLQQIWLNLFTAGGWRFRLGFLLPLFTPHFIYFAKLLYVGRLLRGAPVRRSIFNACSANC